MTPRERVKNALRFEPQEFPPFTWGFGPNPHCRTLLNEAFRKEKGLCFDTLQRLSEDVVWLHPGYCGPELKAGQIPYMAIWGVETQTIRSGGAVYEDEIAVSPLAGVTDIETIESHRWPQVGWFDLAGLTAQRRFLDPEGEKGVRLSGGNPFEIYCWLVGMDNALVHLIDDPDLVEAGMRRITGFFKAKLAAEVAAFAGEVDLVFIADDIGQQQGPMLSPALYRERVQPWHRDLCDHIRGLLPDAVIEYHSDGSVFRMIPDLLDAGVQFLEAVQVECAGMAPEELAAAYGDRLGFQGGISVQGLLPKATPQEVKDGCRRLIGTLGARGGYLAAPSHAIQVGTPVDNLLAMLEAMLGPERYAVVLEGAGK